MPEECSISARGWQYEVKPPHHVPLREDRGMSYTQLLACPTTDDWVLDFTLATAGATQRCYRGIGFPPVHGQLRDHSVGQKVPPDSSHR